MGLVKAWRKVSSLIFDGNVIFTWASAQVFGLHSVDINWEKEIGEEEGRVHGAEIHSRDS